MNMTANAKTVLEKRYLQKTNGNIENAEQMFRRVARNISEAELIYNSDEHNRLQWETTFYDIMTSLEFLPNSPTLMNAGTNLQQLSACFVLPVGDSMESIFDSVKNAALIHKSGGGTGFSFSRLRPKDDVVQSTHAISSGPISFMGVFDAATEAVKQGGRRRGANMAILRVDHPDILAFIEAKKNHDRLNNFNISVAVTDEFMEAFVKGETYPLINPRTGAETSRVDAREVFDTIIRAAWDNGEPGVVFIDRINRDNPTPDLGEIESTNPCGEQPLLPYESCNLGSLNLNAILRERHGALEIDYDRLARNVHIAVRFLDNVIDMNRYPLVEISDITRANRKIGLGVMGFADMLIGLGIPYDSEQAVSLAGDLMAFIRAQSIAATEELADERGPFSNFSTSIYAKSGQRPRRNSTTTTIAPTGTISIIAGVSSGIEPLFALAYARNVLDNSELIETSPAFEDVARREGFYSEDLLRHIAQHGGVADVDGVPDKWKAVFRTSHDISPTDHIRMQAAFQKHTDNAVSKTVNVPKDASTDDVARIFLLAYELGCKGVTVYRDGSREAQVLSTATTRSGKSNGKPKRPRRRPNRLVGLTRKMPTGCGSLYVTVNEDSGGPFELFAQMGKAGGCAASQAEAIGRLVSLALRAGIEPSAIVKQLRGVRCPSPSWNDGSLVLSCADAISKSLEYYLMEKQPHDTEMLSRDSDSIVNRCAGLCIDCGTPLEFDGGCSVCRSCGYSRCG